MSFVDDLPISMESLIQENEIVNLSYSNQCKILGTTKLTEQTKRAFEHTQ